MCVILVFFFFKQKTAYEMRISDWSSDVCSSDLPRPVGGGQRMAVGVAFGGAEDVAIVAHVLRGEAGSGGHLDEGPGVEGAARDRVDERLAHHVRQCVTRPPTRRLQ